ncbi:hypothetical protein NCCP2222_35630 [Sporosarcina sp. NCCP-2222]|uniref:hypothetical protein n=1 Tax=Sporosarcina sp. NCCP-2222 TaxID=2935073 RepID=UPI00208D5A9A|nr:hypothetical protein [Sporosarcina sp. NCCP-2222]GKV57616.1 hypothetical protein NCCP2222_35630 [Sporosarcina sp. NCCP-2222]
MKILRNLVLTGILALLLTGCAEDMETVEPDVAKKIDVSNYFPSIGMARTYVQYGTDGENMQASDIVKMEHDSEGKEMVYIHGKGGLIAETIQEYKVDKKAVSVIYIINSLKNEETNILELASKEKWETNDADNSVSYLTGSGLTEEVPAGSFDNVIEVTTVIPDDKREQKTVKYYAPEVGLIKTVFHFKDGEKYVFSELESYEMTDEQEVMEEVEGSTVEESGEEPAEQAEENTTDGEQALQDGSYSNTQYQFSFSMPQAMLERMEVDTGSWDKDAIATIDFSLHDSSRKLEQGLFSIIVFENTGDEWDHPVYKYVGENDKYVFAYTTSSEPTEAMLLPENADLLQEAQDMIQASQEAMDSFEAK